MGYKGQAETALNQQYQFTRKLFHDSFSFLFAIQPMLQYIEAYLLLGMGLKKWAVGDKLQSY